MLELVFFTRFELRKGIVLFCDLLDQLALRGKKTDMEGVKAGAVYLFTRQLSGLTCLLHRFTTSNNRVFIIPRDYHQVERTRVCVADPGPR